MGASEALQTLFNLATGELTKAQRDGAVFFTRGDIAQIRVTADRVENIQALIKQLQVLQESWELTFPDRETGLPHPEAQRGRRTPEGQFVIPILQALMEMGGKSKMWAVVTRVGEIMASQLNDVDCQVLHDGRTIRWRNATGWARLNMVHKGLLRNDSPTGIWEITEEGRKYLEDHQQVRA